MTKIIAHRGASAEAPENTIAAFQHAINMGAHFLECDVHLANDGVPVIIHDNCLSRTTNVPHPKPVKHLSSLELKALDAGSWFSESHFDEKIPTLSELLKMERNGVGLMIELKDHLHTNVELVSSVMSHLDPYVEENIILASYSEEVIELVLQRNPKQKVMGIMHEPEHIGRFLTLGVRHLAIDHLHLTPAAMRLSKQAQTSIWSYTVDHVDRARQLINWGVEGIITNNPRSLLTELIHKN
jgi:glycerophosphoryl diester phosphodiesterase